MKRSILQITALSFILAAGTLHAGILSDNNPPVKKLRSEDNRTNFQIGAGMMGSVLYLSRNVKDDNDAFGYSLSANYGGHKMCRVSVQYTFYKSIDIAPTWYNIHAHTLESNVEVQARFKNNKSFLYPFAGLSYNTFSGYFTGRNDYYNLKAIYNVNQTATSNWIGVNVGTSFEHHFGPVVLYIDYRMRVGKGDNGPHSFNIMDICYGGGLRYQISAPTFKKIYRGLTDKYTWF